ncbi:hypothetical protein EDC02_5120 [Micromonospora sp. Llam0]|nr:hypothetical protein EDC02_5120 [Micromonospora sp. Llam0]
MDDRLGALGSGPVPISWPSLVKRDVQQLDLTVVAIHQRPAIGAQRDGRTGLFKDIECPLRHPVNRGRCRPRRDEPKFQRDWPGHRSVAGSSLLCGHLPLELLGRSAAPLALTLGLPAHVDAPDTPAAYERSVPPCLRRRPESGTGRWAHRHHEHAREGSGTNSRVTTACQFAVQAVQAQACPTARCGGLRMVCEEPVRRGSAAPDAERGGPRSARGRGHETAALRLGCQARALASRVFWTTMNGTASR